MTEKDCEWNQRSPMNKTLGLAFYCKSFSINSYTCAVMGTPRKCVAMWDDDVYNCFVHVHAHAYTPLHPPYCDHFPYLAPLMVRT